MRIGRGLLSQMARGWWVIGLAIPTLLLLGCAGGGGVSSIEEQAQGIDKSLMCPVCPSETIQESQVELAKQIRAIVRQKLAEGQSRKEILQFFVDKYGESVLAAPRKSGFSLLIWIVPPLAFAGGTLLLFLLLRGMRRSGALTRQEPLASGGAEVEPYLAMVDQELQPPQRDRGTTTWGPSSNTPPKAPTNRPGAREGS